MDYRKGSIVDAGRGMGSPRISKVEVPKQTMNECEQNYQALVETTNTGYLILDAEARVVDANRAYLRLTGRETFEEILGARVGEWTAPYDLARNEEAIRQCFAMGRVRDLVIDYVTPEGGVTPIEIDATAVQTSTGLRLLALCKDITERRRVERSLREIENIFNLFLEHSPVYIFFKDTDLRALRLSRNFEQMLGKPLDQLLGKTMDELFPPELAMSMIEDDRRILQSNTLMKVEEELGGNHFSTIKFPVPQEGKPPFLAGITLDVTEQKRTEEALRESEARFRSLFEQTTVGMVVVSPEGRFLQANPAFQAFLGYSEAELRELTFSEVTHPDFRQQDLANVQACLRGEIPFYSTEKLYRRQDGQAVWGRVHVNPLRDGLGNPHRLITLIEDISERKIAEAALHRSEDERQRLEMEIQHAQKLESLGSLAGGVAHDMNNVLQAIQGMAAVLKVKCAQDPAVVASLEIILNASNRGRNLVRNLTDFARKGLQENQFLDLNRIIREEVELLQHTTMQRIELQVELSDSLPQILGDPSSIGNALMNLCVNALDAMPEKGVLRFRTRRLDSGAVELMVEDTGHGMPPEVLARATEPFFTTKPEGKGTGLGLSGVYGTMKAHGGSMEIQSEVGKGTRAILRFQAVEGRSASLVAAIATPARQRGEKSMKILLVDDDELIRDSFPDLMEILGHEVVATAPTGHEAIRLIEEGLEVDVVVLDHNMPGLSGIETLLRLRALKAELPIIFCTGHLDDSVRNQLKGRTGVWTLMKPYSIKDIRPILSNIIQG